MESLAESMREQPAMPRFEKTDKVVHDGYAETLADCKMPPRALAAHPHKQRDRVPRQGKRRRTRLVGAFPDGKSALMLAV